MSFDNFDATENLAEGIEDLETLDDVSQVEAGSRGFELETEGQISDSIELLNQMLEIQPDIGRDWVLTNVSALFKTLKTSWQKFKTAHLFLLNLPT